MKPRTAHLLKTIILLGLGAFLLVKIFTGTLYYYINQRFLWLVALGALTFLILGWISLRSQLAHRHHDHEHDHAHHHDHAAAPSNWGLFIVAIPLLLGFLVPARPLDSSALSSRGLTNNAITSAADAKSGTQLDVPSDERTVLDWIRAFNFAPDPSAFDGENADLIGFVYHDDRLPADQVLVGRFAVTCCVADAFAIGVIVQSPDAADWATNTWVHVTGEMHVGQLEGDAYPLIVADTIKEVPVPPQPYLFP